jgi:hypothetical protein
MSTARYTICALCDHFVMLNDDEGVTTADFVHLEDGEQGFDHDARPSPAVMTLDGWKAARPDLFITHRDDKVGPNSRFHPRVGKVNE